MPNLNVEESNQLNYELNKHIEKEEILKCIKKLKNNKARGEDAIIKNEYIKATSDQFIVDYEKLFNLIFESGIVPESWLIRNIIPIYKNKGFIDFEKAFDQMWRDCLWYKLLLNNINGKMFQIIQNMYKNIKPNIVYNNDKSEFFPCDNGVR